jgi:hypothetical protein
LEPDHIQFGGGVSETILNPLVLLLVLIAGVLICFLPKNRIVIPFLTLAILIPTDQVLLVGSLHFPVMRILALFGLVRISWAKLTSKGPVFSGGINGIDIAFIVLSLFTALNGILLWRELPAIVFQFGNLYAALGIYLLLRFAIHDEEDVRQVLRLLVCVTVVIAVIMICEQLTGRNPYYAVLGGARASEYGAALEVRDGHIRATGCFAHPILAGTFGGFCLPLFVALWWKGEKKDRKYAAIGIVSAMVLPLAASSSTALFGFLAGLFALILWPLRRRMRIIRWGVVIVLVSLHLVMKAPVWHLISRVDLSGGSSSYHRYDLINQCILHFWNWALIGTKDYGSWGWSLWDLSDQYVGVADTAGLIPLLSFLAIFVFAFKYLGQARKLAIGDKKAELFVWAFGASLFANTIAFFGIDYFDQTIVAWYALLAMISAVTLSARTVQPVPEFEVAMPGSGLGFRSELASHSPRNNLSS